jgi:hypothetical protein
VSHLPRHRDQLSQSLQELTVRARARARSFSSLLFAISRVRSCCCTHCECKSVRPCRHPRPPVCQCP